MKTRIKTLVGDTGHDSTRAGWGSAKGRAHIRDGAPRRLCAAVLTDQEVLAADKAVLRNATCAA